MKAKDINKDIKNNEIRLDNEKEKIIDVEQDQKFKEIEDNNLLFKKKYRTILNLEQKPEKEL